MGRAAGRRHGRDGEGDRMSSLSVSASGAAADAIGRHVPTLVEDSVASRLFAQDPTLWGPDAESESRIRLSWVGLPRSSRPLVGEIAALRDSFAEQGLTHVVLCGMGGSSLAPEVICATAGKPLVVLDSSDPDYVRRGPRRRPRPHGRRRLEQVRLHGRDRLPAPRLRAGVHRRRHRPGVAHRHRHRPGQPARRGVARQGLPRRQRRPRRRRPLLRADRLRPRAERPRRRRRRGAARRGGVGGRPARRRRRRQPRPAPRRGHGRHRPAARQARPRRRRLRHRRFRRLGRAAHRRVHRQERHRRAARRRRWRRGPRGRRWPAADVTVARLVAADSEFARRR